MFTLNGIDLAQQVTSSNNGNEFMTANRNDKMISIQIDYITE